MSDIEWEKRLAIREYKAQLVENIVNAVGGTAILSYFVWLVLGVFL